MKHVDCVNYINLDCEKGEGSEACPMFKAAPKCGNCACFQGADDHGIGTCTGFEKENWSYANCGAFCCEHYKAVQE